MLKKSSNQDKDLIESFGGVKQLQIKRACLRDMNDELWAECLSPAPRQSTPGDQEVAEWSIAIWQAQSPHSLLWFFRGLLLLLMLWTALQPLRRRVYHFAAAAALTFAARHKRTDSQLARLPWTSQNPPFKTLIGELDPTTEILELHCSPTPLPTRSDVSLLHFLDSVDEVEMPLRKLCDKIASFRMLQCAKVIAAEGYVVNSWVRHRYIILELELPGDSSAWLRLDRRRPAESIFTFISASSTSPAHDTARLCLDKDALVDPASSRETRQVFKRAREISLGDFRHYLLAIIGNLKRYKLYQENCWAFVSVVQELLGASNRGCFVQGHLQHTRWAHQMRLRVACHIWHLYHMDPPLITFTEILKHPPTDSSVLLPVAIWHHIVQHPLALSQQWDNLDPASPKAPRVAAQMFSALQTYGIHSSIVLCTRAVRIARSVSESDLMDDGRDGLVQMLLLQTYAFGQHGDLLQAYNSSLEAAVRARALFRDHPQRHGRLLWHAMRAHMDTLDACAGRRFPWRSDPWRKPSLSEEQLQLETKGWKEEFDKHESYRRSLGLDPFWEPCVGIMTPICTDTS